jgi:hypothetical protein
LIGQSLIGQSFSGLPSSDRPLIKESFTDGPLTTRPVTEGSRD